MRHRVICQSPEAVTFLSRVVGYHLTGMQFDGLHTSHRPSTKLERCVVGVIGGAARSTMCAVSVQYSSCVEAAFGGQLPFRQADEAAAAVVGSMLVVIGVGADNSEIWRYDVEHGWKKCCGGWGGLVAGRRRHCVVALDSAVYAVAGYCPKTRSLTGFVERYDTVTNQSAPLDGARANIPVPVVSAAAAGFRSDIFVFGGIDGAREPVLRTQVTSDVGLIGVQPLLPHKYLRQAHQTQSALSNKARDPLCALSRLEYVRKINHGLTSLFAQRYSCRLSLNRKISVKSTFSVHFAALYRISSFCSSSQPSPAED